MFVLRFKSARYDPAYNNGSGHTEIYSHYSEEPSSYYDDGSTCASRGATQQQHFVDIPTDDDEEKQKKDFGDCLIDIANQLTTTRKSFPEKYRHMIVNAYKAAHHQRCFFLKSRISSVIIFNRRQLCRIKNRIFAPSQIEPRIRHDGERDVQHD